MLSLKSKKISKEKDKDKVISKEKKGQVQVDKDLKDYEGDVEPMK